MWSTLPGVDSYPPASLTSTDLDIRRHVGWKLQWSGIPALLSSALKVQLLCYKGHVFRSLRLALMRECRPFGMANRSGRVLADSLGQPSEAVLTTLNYITQISLPAPDGGRGKSAKSFTRK